MAKNIFQDFTWTDRKSRPLYSPSNEGAPTIVGYQTARIGGLSALGRALSGIAAPFAGDFQYGQKQYEADLKQQQADMEFAALLEKNRIQQKMLEGGRSVYSINPLTGNLEYTGNVGEKDIVRGIIPTAEQQAEVQQAKEQAKGVPIEQYGKVELAKEALKNLDKVESTLYPNGRNESFRRDIAGYSRFEFPLLGQAPFNKDAQNVFRQLSTSLGGRTLIETGVSSNADERKKKVLEFMASYGSDPQAFRDAINQNREFYKGYLNTVKTRGYDLKENNINKKEENSVNSQGWNDAKAARLEELRKKLGKNATN